MVNFTVAIPTYNGEKRLPRILARLREVGRSHSVKSQTNFHWEILIIDNNSNDNTADVVREYQANWSDTYPLRYSFEAKQGAAFARQRAIKEARGKLIGFLDDDNLPDENWVAAAYAFAQAHPQVGAYGGQIHGDFEVNPPENFKRIQSFLAIRERGSQPHRYDPDNLVLPPAAALVVRKQAWLETVPSCPTLGGKAYGSMVQGDDYEPLLYMHKAGWEIWYNPAMHTYHQIPKWRFEKDYLLSLIRGSSLCIYQLRLIGAKNWQKPIITARIMLGSLRRATLHLLKYRRQVKTDLIAACEMEFHWSSFVSPFYFWKTSIFHGRKQ